MAKQDISTAEAARRLGVALTYVYSLLWAGKLKAHKVNRQWQIPAAAIESRLKARGE
jgi:excisionase family DNA binding protein